MEALRTQSWGRTNDCRMPSGAEEGRPPTTNRLCSVQSAVLQSVEWNVPCAVRSVKCAVCIVVSAELRFQCEKCSVKCVVCSVQCAVCGV